GGQLRRREPPVEGDEDCAATLGRRTENGKIRAVAGKNRDALSGGPVQPLPERRSAGRNPAIEVAPGKALACCEIDACERVGPRLRVKRDAIGGRRRRGHARGL